MKNFARLAGLCCLLGTFIFLERRRPLRRERESKLRRTTRNITIAALGAVTVHLVESPLLYPLAYKIERRRWGLLKQLRLPKVVEVAGAVALLDYTLYLQHILHHKAPLFWRFHAVHHLDLDS